MARIKPFLFPSEPACQALVLGACASVAQSLPRGDNPVGCAALKMFVLAGLERGYTDSEDERYLTQTALNSLDCYLRDVGSEFDEVPA